MKSPPKTQEKQLSQDSTGKLSHAEMFAYEIKIPKDRIAVLIGTKGSIKKRLEAYGGCRVTVDSKEGIVTLQGGDSLKLFDLQNVIKAIGRGFNPEIAQLLLKQDYCLEIIQLNDFNMKKNHQMRLKGRVIGEDGKARRTIEGLTGTFMSVYGKTIAVVGPVEHTMLAKRAVESLLGGSQHSAVFKWLERQRKKLKDPVF